LITHSEIIKKIAKLLRENDFYVRTHCSLPIYRVKGIEVYHAFTEKKPRWTAIVDVLGLEMKKDGLGEIVQGTGGKKLNMLGKTIAVEVSISSDVKKEVEKLKQLPVQLRLIVTTDPVMRGELAGIPIVCYYNLNSTIVKNLKQTYYCDHGLCDYFTTNREEMERHEKEHD